MIKNNMFYTPNLPKGFHTYDFNIDEWIKLEEENRMQIKRIEERAIQAESLLYRFLYEPVADGKGIYQIIRLNKKTCRLRYCSTDGYQSYVVRQWGEEATVSMDYVLQSIRAQNLYLR